MARNWVIRLEKGGKRFWRGVNFHISGDQIQLVLESGEIVASYRKADVVEAYVSGDPGYVI